MIDYGIVSHDVKHGLTTLIDHGVPSRPHYGVVHLVKGSLCKIWTKQLIRPGKMRPSKEMKICDTMDWATASRVASQITKANKRTIDPMSTSHACEMGDPLISYQLSKKYSDWVTTAEVQMLSEISHDPRHIRPYTGSGIPFQLKWLPVVQREPPEYMHSDGQLSFLYHVEGLLQAAQLNRDRGHKAATAEVCRRLTNLTVPRALLDISGKDISSRVRGWFSYAHTFQAIHTHKALYVLEGAIKARARNCLLYTSPSPRDS